MVIVGRESRGEKRRRAGRMERGRVEKERYRGGSRERNGGMDSGKEI
jgi:hypothetical protein